MKSSLLLLKTVLCESHIDTKSTSTETRKKLSNLDQYDSTGGNGMNKFNVHVKTLIKSLLSLVDISTDLLDNLLRDKT